jgi:hypothetical protein
LRNYEKQRKDRDEPPVSPFLSILIRSRIVQRYSRRVIRYEMDEAGVHDKVTCLLGKLVTTILEPVAAFARSPRLLFIHREGPLQDRRADGPYRKVVPFVAIRSRGNVHETFELIIACSHSALCSV